MKCSNTEYNCSLWEWQALGVANPGSGDPWEWWTLGVVHPGNGGPWECGAPWEWWTLGVVHPASGGLWEWCTLGVVHPGSGAPWEWRTLGVSNPGSGGHWDWWTATEQTNCWNVASRAALYLSAFEGGNTVYKLGPSYLSLPSISTSRQFNQYRKHVIKSFKSTNTRLDLV